MQLYMTHLLFVSDQTIFLLSAVKHNGVRTDGENPKGSKNTTAGTSNQGDRVTSQIPCFKLYKGITQYMLIFTTNYVQG